MPSITREQINNLNSKCSNGWELDVIYCEGFGQKTFVKQIECDKENFLQFKISYNSNNQILLRISEFYHKENSSVATSEGQSSSIVLDETQVTRRTVNTLIEYTKFLNNKKLLEIYQKQKEQK